MAELKVRFRVRRRTAAEWVSVNEVLLDAEIGLETDTRKFKFGDGATVWNSLPYAEGLFTQSQIEEFARDALGAALTAGTNISISVNDGANTITIGFSGDLALSNFAQGSALSVLGVAGNATADHASIAAGSDHQVLRRSGTALAFGAVNLAQSAAVTDTLAVANGGTGVTSSTGSGSVVLSTNPSISSSTIGGNTALPGSGLLDSSGRLGLGTTPSVALHVVGALPVVRIDTTDTSALYGLEIGASPDATFKARGTTGELRISSGRSAAWGGFMTFYIDNAEAWRIENGGAWRPASDNTVSLCTAAHRASVVYAGTGAINTSDEREKRDIGSIPDEWLDAWGEVKWVRYRFKDGQRWHVGLVAQHVRDAFAARGLDAREIGILCYDEWSAIRAIRAKHDRKGKLIREAQPGRKAGNIWGLRYDECEAMEAAYLRRKLDDLAALLSDRTV